MEELIEKLREKGLLNKSGENRFGLIPYVRKAYEYNTKLKTNAEKSDIFNKELSEKWECDLIDFVSRYGNEKE
ncbi:hypothetical protein [Mycoplasma sp. 1458C]|uniref:hypothetical protein n=1 Tax=unclassified Mycoplasma TaxID=2683645 RepID=UPI003AAF6CD0